MNSYFIECGDFVALDTEVNKIIRDDGFSDAEVSIYDMSESLLSDAIEDLDTYGFLASKKIVVIRGIENVLVSENLDEIEHLLRYIKNPSSDNLLIIESRGFKKISSDDLKTNEKRDDKENDKSKKSINLEKELKKCCKVISVELNTKSFIKASLKGYKASSDVINLIDEYCLGDFTKIDSECCKLKNYKSDTKEISVDDVKNLVQKKLGDSKNLTFSFARNLGEKNIKEALLDYHELLNYNVESLQIIGLLASQFRIIYQVKLLSKRGLRDREIASMLDEKEFRITKTRELIPLYSEREVLKIMQELSEMDMRLKTTDTSPISELELFITNI